MSRVLHNYLVLSFSPPTTESRWVESEMAQAIRNAKVPPNSVNLSEARQRVFEFFRSACRSLPTVMEVYNLYDVATVSQLRSTIAAEIRKNDHITNPKVPSSKIFQFPFSTFFRENLYLISWRLELLDWLRKWI